MFEKRARLPSPLLSPFAFALAFDLVPAPNARARARACADARARAYARARARACAYVRARAYARARPARWRLRDACPLQLRKPQRLPQGKAPRDASTRLSVRLRSYHHHS